MLGLALKKKYVKNRQTRNTNTERSYSHEKWRYFKSCWPEGDAGKNFSRRHHFQYWG